MMMMTTTTADNNNDEMMMVSFKIVISSFLFFSIQLLGAMCSTMNECKKIMNIDPIE